MNKLEEEKNNNNARSQKSTQDARKWIHYLRSRLRTYTNKYIRIHQNKKG